MTKSRFKCAYNRHPRVQFETVGPSLTHQSMAPECDINRIMLKWQKTGVLEHRNTFEGQYGDFTDLPQDYHESMNAVIAAEDMFMTLPSTVRRRFLNDPGNFLEFVSDPTNKEEIEKMGLAKPAPKPESDPEPSPKPATKPETKPDQKPDSKPAES